MLMPHNDLMIQAIFWSALTIGFHMFGKLLYRHASYWWTSPMIVSSLLLIAAAIMLHETYRQYSTGTHWLVTLLAPATVSFAVPIYEQRRLIRRHWLLLIIGIAAGSSTALASSWALSCLLGLDDSLRLSLMPRSLSTPFAMTVSSQIGGVPSLTALFVVITGTLGVIMGEVLLKHLPLQSSMARGALLGMGAHGAGTAKAHQINEEVGAIAGLVMVLVGIINVLAAPLLSRLLN